MTCAAAAAAAADKDLATEWHGSWDWRLSPFELFLRLEYRVGGVGWARTGGAALEASPYPFVLHLGRLDEGVRHGPRRARRGPRPRLTPGGSHTSPHRAPAPRHSLSRSRRGNRRMNRAHHRRSSRHCLAVIKKRNKHGIVLSPGRRAQCVSVVRVRDEVQCPGLVS